MPLSDPSVARKPVHVRRIECRGFERGDGCYDIEGHLTDTKAHVTFNTWKGECAAGAPIHDMWLRFTVDSNLNIRSVDAASDAHPFASCPSVVPNFQALCGLRITGGFQRKVKELLGNTQGCTHLVDLAGMVAIAALQTLGGLRLARLEAGQIPEKPLFINSCRGWAADGPVVEALYPALFTGRKAE
jgi:DUF2889 family protein